MKKEKGCACKILFIGLLMFALGAGAVYGSTFLKSEMVTFSVAIGSGFIFLGILVLLGIKVGHKNQASILFEQMRTETRPVLSYLGRVLSKSEEQSQHAQTVVNSSTFMKEAMGQNLKMSLDANSKMIIPFEETQTINMEVEDDSPIIAIRPFYLANYGKSIAVGLFVSLNGEKISFRSESILEPNAKIKLEINDTIKFTKNLREFTLTYADVYGHEYVMRLDGIIEYGKEESVKLGRDVYFFYVEGFSELE